jgi:hemerythrin-like metal-binding protein
MTGLTWNRIKHDVKVDKMNEQHKLLFNILDSLYKVMENKDDRNALVKIINDLITYSKQHLTTEEALLEKYDYPELAEQKAILAFLNDDSFYSVLRNKLHWGISPEYLKDAPVV